MKHCIYLDHAATTGVRKEVLEAMLPYFSEHPGNPSARYHPGQTARKAITDARERIAALLHAEPEEIFFTSGGTESDNWAIQAALWQNRHRGRHIITTAVEHSAILEPCKLLAQQGYEVTYLKPDRTGQITAAQVADALRDDTALVSVMLVNNETGCVFPVEEIAALLRRRGSDALLHCDAVQGFLKVPCDPEGWGVDMMSLSAHKLGGPKGIGALYIGQRVRNPGGGQERGVRSGTEATAQIAGFAKAVELRREDYEGKLAHMAALKDYCRTQLLTIDGMVCVGEGTAPHILAMSLVGYPSGNIVTDLGAQGICISAGSACHQGKASHVVSALGLDKKTAAGVIRISFSPDNTEADVDALCRALKSHRDSRFPML